jgi:hypothetical protein
MPSSDGKRIDALDFTHHFRASRRQQWQEARRKSLSDIASLHSLGPDAVKIRFLNSLVAGTPQGEPSSVFRAREKKR